jgi:hypothetical protein
VKHEDTGPEHNLDDDRLSERLRDLLRRTDSPPHLAVELAKQSFALRSVDAELAALVADSEVDGLAVTVRNDEPDGPRLLTFETEPSPTGDIAAVEVELGGPGGRRLLGQMHPPGPARIEVRQPAAAGPRWVEADDHGRFAIEDMAAGPFSLTCHAAGRRPVTTAWTTLP